MMHGDCFAGCCMIGDPDHCPLFHGLIYVRSGRSLIEVDLLDLIPYEEEIQNK